MWMRESVELFAGWVCMDYGSSLLQSWPDEEKWAPIIQKLRNTYTEKKSWHWNYPCCVVFILSAIVLDLISEYCQFIPQCPRSFFFRNLFYVRVASCPAFELSNETVFVCAMIFLVHHHYTCLLILIWFGFCLCLFCIPHLCITLCWEAHFLKSCLLLLSV